MGSRERTVVVAVIGVSGSGKSAFINLASGLDSLVDKSGSVANPTISLKSSTFSLDGRTVTLIDTPGFGDPSPSVLEVLKLISDHFSRLENVKLGGVIYMHCLTEDHMRGRSSHSFHTFNKFCGGTNFQDVLIVTDEEGFVDKNAFFGLLNEKDARVLYHDGSQASAHAILRRLLSGDRTVPPAQGNLPNQKVDSTCTSSDAEVVRSLTGQIKHRTKAFGELYQRIDAATFAEDGKTGKTMQVEANDSLEKIEHIRYDLEQLVMKIATEKSRLEDENRRYRTDSAAQMAEAKLRIRLLGEERRAREVAEASRERAEAQLAEGRALLERQRIERERLPDLGGLKYDKLFAGGALILLVLCVSRFAFHGSPL